MTTSFIVTAPNQRCRITATLSMDVCMLVTDGMAGTRQICQQWPDTKVLMLTTFDDPEYVAQVLQAGASGYLLKNIPFDELTQAIAFLFKGGRSRCLGDD
ncbi:MAG: response regulator transcription factor [Cyanobacteria bacterium P01_F01_bin.150]